MSKPPELWIPPFTSLTAMTRAPHSCMMRAVWDTFQNGTKPAFEGEHYRFKLMSPFFDSGPIDTAPPKIALARITPYAEVSAPYPG